jgi:hypothetical protein
MCLTLPPPLCVCARMYIPYSLPPLFISVLLSTPTLIPPQCMHQEKAVIDQSAGRERKSEGQPIKN